MHCMGSMRLYRCSLKQTRPLLAPTIFFFNLHACCLQSTKALFQKARLGANKLFFFFLFVLWFGDTIFVYNARPLRVVASVQQLQCARTLAGLL